MAKQPDYNDSNLSKPTSREHESEGPTRQRHRLARGEKITGTSNPYGEPPNTAKKIGNDPKSW